MGSLGDAWRNEPDFQNRDPHGINDGLQVAFEDVIAEPDHTHSSDCAWKCAYRCFRVWKMLCYSIFTTCCSWAVGCYWGCVFACIAIDFIWCETPGIAVLTVYLNCMKRLCTAFTDAFLAPVCLACGHIFNAFRSGGGQQKAM